jgi:hypothetical protein
MTTFKEDLYAFIGMCAFITLVFGIVAMMQ